MKKAIISLPEAVLYALLGSFMFASKQVMEVFPNVHILGMLTVLYTLLFRVRALIPVYVFILLEGILCGFNIWWVPYLYIWAVLWGAAMLIPRRLKPVWLSLCCIAVCGAHGFLYGTLYAPFQAWAFGLNFKGMIAWIISGIPFDVVHGVSNSFMGILIVPLYLPLKKEVEKLKKL